MYNLILILHSFVRWLVLIAALAATVRAFIGWLGKQTWGRLDERLGFFYTLTMDVQVLLGIILLVVSPLIRAGLSDLGTAMADPTLRFFLLIHWLLMLIAVGLAHMGSSLARKVQGERRKFRTAAIFYTLSILLILVAIPWPFTLTVQESSASSGVTSLNLTTLWWLSLSMPVAITVI